MSLWLRFACVLLAQLCVFIASVIWWRVPLRRAARVLLLSMIAGAPLGLTFDLAIGHYETVFGYYAFTPTMVFFVANGIFSYGLTIANVWLLPAQFIRHRNWPLTILASVLFVVSAIVLLVLPVSDFSTLFVMSVGGTAIIVIAEAVGVFCGVRGPFLEAFSGRPRLLGRLWLLGGILGTVYEGANWFFPVWRWQSIDMSVVQQEVLLVFMGYLVLVYPMFMLTHVIRSRNAAVGN